MKLRTLYFIIIFIAALLLSLNAKANVNESELIRNQDNSNQTQYNPNAVQFSPEQDSAYVRAMRMNIPLATRFELGLRLSSLNWELREKISEGKTLNFAFKELQEKYPDLLMPSAVDVMHHKINIASSFDVPYTTTFLQTAARLSMQDVSRFLGLTGDYRPIIFYSLDYTAEVQVLVYSISASVVATLFDGVQKPGSYELSWNLRDDNGKKMPAGDYIMEVRVGNAKYIRKRCIVN